MSAVQYNSAVRLARNGILLSLVVFRQPSSVLRKKLFDGSSVGEFR